MPTRFSLVFGTLVVLGASTQAQAQRRINVAAGKQAFQSSTAHGADASRAVDGNVDGAFFNGSVTHTDAGPGEWWMVDLGAPHQIRSVTVYNRTDCCAERLDARVVVSTTRRPESAVYEGELGPVGARADVTVGAVGRYVWVLQNSANHLQLAEVVVRGTPSYSRAPASRAPGGANLAEGREATQSSTTHGGDASRAVDGNTDGAFFSGSVTHTDARPNEWWMVDLGAMQDIGSITIHNRTDCCGERLDARVIVTATRGTESPLFLRELGPVGESTTVPVGARGRYVWVVQNSANHLQLAEVVVRAGRRSSPASAFGNVAAGKQATQSTTAHGADASRAVDGN
ncbi:MAG TPA: discoidin domain-containing protein, partial [Longimicrobiaceae bacterium]|nr:discoidin domain-containing protein [Longimicrobiaceae bacterium]